MTTNEQVFNNELDGELLFSFSRSSGPGGQNVNKVNTKVELRFNISKSLVLSDSQKEVLLTKLEKQISKDGDLIVFSQNSRSQMQNKEDAVRKFYEIVNEALKPIKKRKAHKISKAAKESRLKEKRENAEKKERRQFRL